MELEIKMDARSLNDFEEAMRSQVPFAGAVALTKTAAQGKDRVRRELPHRFIIRNQFTANSIRHQRAEKRDWPNSKSVIGSISDYMALQEEGGAKAPASKAFAIPKGIRTSINKIVPRAKWPGKILPTDSRIPAGGRSQGAIKGSRSKAQPFLLREHGGIGVYVRIGKGRALKRLYRLTKSEVRIHAKHWLETPVGEVCQANLEQNFVRALEDAVKSRK